MLIFIPITRADLQFGVPLARHIVNLGGIKRHDVVLFYSGVEAMKVADEMEDILAHQCGILKKVDSENKDERGWPMSANTMFFLSARWVERSGYKGPWYFFELDSTPMRSGWADALQDEYLSAGRPFMGVKQGNIWTSPEGVRTADGGYHMVGTGIYPAPLSPHSTLWRHLGTVSFDVFLMHETVPFMHHTDLIQHNWCSQNYRKEDGKIISDPTKGHEDSGISLPICPKTMVLHGCKDLSLLKLFKRTTKSDSSSQDG